jgi:selenocysteine lyase/cysteine desulfurase
MLTPKRGESGLVAFHLSGADAAGYVARLAEQKIHIRGIPDNGALRISCGFYNTTDDIDRTIVALDAARRESVK